MAATDRDRFDGYINPLSGLRRNKATTPGTFGSGARFGPQPAAPDSRQRLAATTPGPLVAGRSGLSYADMATIRSVRTPRSKTPGAPRSAVSHGVSERRAMTPPSRPEAKVLMAGATTAQMKRSPVPEAGPSASRQAAQLPSRRVTSTSSAYPATRPRTPSSVAYPQPSARSRTDQLPTPRRPTASIKTTPTRSVSRSASTRRLDSNATPPAARIHSIPRGGMAGSNLSTPHPSAMQLPSQRSLPQGRVPQANTNTAAPGFRDPDDDWLGTYERTSAGLFQELEGILGGIARLQDIAPAPVEARAPPLQLPPAPYSPSGSGRPSGASLRPGSQGQVASTQGSSQPGSAVRAARYSAISSVAAPLMASPLLSATEVTQSQRQSDVPGVLVPTESNPGPDMRGRMGTAPCMDTDYAAAAGSAGVAARVTPAVSLPPGAIGDLWNVLQARNRQTAKLIADLAAARREAQLATERAEEADGLARAFQQQLIARQQHVASWQAALEEMEEREVAAKQLLLGARERCEELARRAQQAEHVAATAQIRLERLIAQREAQMAAGSQAGGQHQRGAEAAERETQSKEAAETLRLQLQQLQADLAAAQTRATRAELELAVARNKALIAKQELASEEDRARRAAATAAVMRQEQGRTQSALERMGRDHDRLQHQLHDSQVINPQRSQPTFATQIGSPQRPISSSTTPRQHPLEKPGPESLRAVQSAPIPVATSHPATGTASSQPPGVQPSAQATAAEGQDKEKAGRISDVIDQDLKDSDDSGFSVPRRALGAAAGRRAGRRLSDDGSVGSSSGPVSNGTRSGGSRTAWPSHSGETNVAASTLNAAPAPVHQRSGSLLLLPPGEVPLDRSASLRYGQPQQLRHRRSRSHDLDTMEPSGKSPRGETSSSPNMGDMIHAGGASGAGYRRPRKQSRFGGSGAANRRLSFEDDGDTPRQLGGEAAAGLNSSDNSSTSDREGDDGSRLEGMSRALGAPSGRAVPSSSETGEEGDMSHGAAAALKAMLADRIPSEGGIHRTLKRGPFLDELLPLSRTPSSGARRRPSGFRVSQSSGLRGVMPGGTGNGCVLGRSPSLQGGGAGGAGGGTAAGSLSSRSSQTAGSGASDMIKARMHSGSEGSGAAARFGAPALGGSDPMGSRALDAPAAALGACEERTAGRARGSTSQGLTETETERVSRKPGSVSVSLADLRRQMRAGEAQSTRGTPQRPTSPARSARTPLAADSTPSRTDSSTALLQYQHPQQTKVEMSEQWQLQLMQGTPQPGKVPEGLVHGGAAWHLGGPGTLPTVIGSRHQGTHVPMSSLTTGAAPGGEGLQLPQQGADAGARLRMPAVGSAYPGSVNPHAASFLASARAAAIGNPTRPGTSGPSSPVLMASPLGALPAGVDLGVPQGYHTSHLNDLYESRASRWPSPILTPHPSNDEGPGQGFPLPYESPRAFSRRGSDTEGPAGQTLPRSRLMIFTPQSRMLSPAQVESYGVAPSLTASMALASPNSSTSFGTFTVQIPLTQGGPVLQFAALPVAARLGSPTSPTPPHRNQAGLRLPSHGDQGPDRQTNTYMEKQQAAPITTAATNARPNAEIEVLGDMPLLHSLSSQPHSAHQAPPGSRAAMQMACAGNTPQLRRRPWWHRLLLPWRRWHPGAATHPRAPDCITRDCHEAISSASSQSDGNPVAVHDEHTAHAPCDGATALSVCEVVGMADVEAGKEGSTSSRGPRRGGGGGRRIVQSALLHFGTWAGGVALGVVLVLGLAGVVEGALNVGAAAERQTLKGAASGRECGCSVRNGGKEDSRAEVNDAGQLCIEVCDSPRV